MTTVLVLREAIRVSIRSAHQACVDRKALLNARLADQKYRICSFITLSSFASVQRDLFLPSYDFVL